MLATWVKTLCSLRACLHGGGGPQVGEVTHLGGVTRLSIYSLIFIWSRLHDRWGDPPRRKCEFNRIDSPEKLRFESVNKSPAAPAQILN